MLEKLQDNQRLKEQIEGMRALDTKFIVVLGFVTVSMVEILGHMILGATESPQRAAYLGGVVKWGVFAGIVASLIASIVGFLALYPRMVSLATNASEEPALGVSQHFSLNAAAASRLNQKRFWINISMTLVLVAILSYSLAASWLFLRFTESSNAVPSAIR